jgi:integrase
MNSASARVRADKNRWNGVYKLETRHPSDIVYYITYKVEGRKVWEKVGTKSQGITPQIAADIRAERLRKALHGEAVKTAKDVRREKLQHDQTLDEVAKAYFESKGDSLKGVVTDKNRYDKHIKPTFGSRRVSSLNELDIVRVKRSMPSHKAATVWNTLELLRRLCNYGAKSRLSPPLRFVIEMPDRNNAKPEYLLADQHERLIEVLESWPSQDVARMVKLAMITAMRKGEIFALKDSDIDRHQGLVTLREPKSGKLEYVYLSKDALTILKEQEVWRDEHFPGSSYLFPGRKGKKRVDCSADSRIKVAAGLPEDFRLFHGLRHHLAVRAINEGEDIGLVSELLRHKSSEFTRQRYAQFLPDTVRTAAERASKLAQQGVVTKKAEKMAGNSGGEK